MLKKLFLVAMGLGLLITVGCAPAPDKTPKVQLQSPAQMDALENNATELKEEKIYLVTLQFKKFSYSLDPDDHIGNWLSAVEKTIIVGEKAYGDYQIGKKVSEKFDWWGTILDGNPASYSVKCSGKEVKSLYSVVTKDGSHKELKPDQHEEALRKVRASGREILTVPFAGTVTNFVLDKPLSQFQITDRQPLQRYFIRVKVENMTITFDPVKHLRNMSTAHEIDMEVPRAAYEHRGNVWNPALNPGSLFWNGRVSFLRGTITKRWMETDSSYVLAHTKEGRDLIIPAR